MRPYHVASRCEVDARKALKSPRQLLGVSWGEKGTKAPSVRQRAKRRNIGDHWGHSERQGFDQRETSDLVMTAEDEHIGRRIEIGKFATVDPTPKVDPRGKRGTL